MERVALDVPANELSIEILVEAPFPFCMQKAAIFVSILNMRWVSRDFATGSVEIRKAGVPLLSAC
jgi:hypothetical protein